eukprot:COSAG01_NODE_11914_length_1836_cov_1.716753_2_plen_131_part_01
MVGMRSDEDSNAENGVINGVARKLKNSQDEVVSHQDKAFKGVQEQAKTMQTSINQTNEQVKAMQKEVQDQFKGVQEQAKAMQTSIDHTNEQVNAMQTAITQTQDQVAQILSLLQASAATPRQDAQPGPSA